jgi:hypothetical protein
MKTFSEACETTFIVKVDNIADDDAVRQATDKVAADVGRWREIEAEIRQSKYVQAYLLGMVAMQRTGQISLSECILTTFIQAVAVGIEMERAE